MLWFGSWKNGKSTYQPVWVKKNQQRFPIIQDEKGKGLPTLSTLSDANRDVDSIDLVSRQDREGAGLVAQQVHDEAAQRRWAGSRPGTNFSRYQ
ncbi:MAG: hypothetical protein ABSC08_20335 [Bryobacteraceae bacterium]|jgi:hypothetical protein